VITRILYATDFSPASLAAWASARELARVFKAELVVLHVVPPLTAPPEGFLSADVFSRYWEGARDAAEAKISKLVAQAEIGDLKIRSRVDKGRAADQILQAAVEEQASVVVVGTAGRSGLQQVFIGSVADEVLRLAQCPVLTAGPVGARLTGSGPILYPTDFSPTATAAWPMAEALALASGADVILLHVMPEVPEDPRTSPVERAKLETDYRRRAEQSVMDLLARSALGKARVRTILAHGVVEEQIVNHAYTDGAGVIVMGTHGWSGLLRWPPGSAAHRVIRTAPCPVLTIGPGR
jgi:nucleotide-binding universal stress UspA family protein